MRALFFGTYESTFATTRTILQGLRAAGAEVFECHVPLFELTRDKTGGFAGPLGLVKLAARIVWAYARLLAKYLRTPGYDVLIVGYMGYLDVIPARILALGRTLVLAPGSSLYDTMVQDRKMVRSRLLARCLWAIDWLGCRLSDVVLLETEEYVRFYCTEFRVPREKCRIVYVGADESNFVPEPGAAEARRDGKFLVFFYGKFTPLQGVPTIVRAAARLMDDPEIAFEIVGSGQMSADIKALAAELGLSNTTFIDWVDYKELPAHIARADVCLGSFGDTDKAKRAVPIKAFDSMAMGRPLIQGDSPGAREIFVHGETAWLVPMADDAALAEGIRTLEADPALRAKLARRARAAFEEKYSKAQIGRALVAALAGSSGLAPAPAARHI